jgi:hypothetical protein
MVDGLVFSHCIAIQYSEITSGDCSDPSNLRMKADTYMDADMLCMERKLLWTVANVYKNEYRVV